MTSQRYIVLSKHPVYGVRTGHYVYLTAEEGARKTASGHVEPAPPPKPKPKQARTRRTVKPPAPPALEPGAIQRESTPGDAEPT